MFVTEVLFGGGGGASFGVAVWPVGDESPAEMTSNNSVEVSGVISGIL